MSPAQHFFSADRQNQYPIHFQGLHGSAAGGRETLNLHAIPTKMFFPRIASRVEQRSLHAGLRV